LEANISRLVDIVAILLNKHEYLLLKTFKYTNYFDVLGIHRYCLATVTQPASHASHMDSPHEGDPPVDFLGGSDDDEDEDGSDVPCRPTQRPRTTTTATPIRRSPRNRNEPVPVRQRMDGELAAGNFLVEPPRRGDGRESEEEPRSSEERACSWTRTRPTVSRKV